MRDGRDHNPGYGRSREGAWIEMLQNMYRQKFVMVAPVRERGLKFHRTSKTRTQPLVAPVRERGLKYAVAERRETGC